MGIKSAAKKVGKAIIFMKLFEDIKDNKEPIEADIAKLKMLLGTLERLIQSFHLKL